MADMMMRSLRAAWRLAPIAALFLIMTPIQSASAAGSASLFPAPFRGLWFSGKSCAGVEGFLLTERHYELYGSFTPEHGGKFTFGRDNSDIIVSATPERLVTRSNSPTANPPGAGAREVVSEVKPGRRVFHWQDQPAKPWALFHCDKATTRDPRGGIMLVFLRRLDDLNHVYDALAAPCGKAGTAPAPCAAAIVRVLDINHDGKVSPAEVTTFLRRYAPLTETMTSDDKSGKPISFDPGDFAAIEGATAIVGPFVSNVVFSNFDYDANGLLSADEIVLALQQENAGGGGIDVQSLLSQSREQVENAMSAVGGLTQMLGASSKQHGGHAPSH